jgi:hypothetical protein
MTTLTAEFFTCPDKGRLVFAGHLGNVCASLGICNKEELLLWPVV